jgi:hypothetical protein
LRTAPAGDRPVPASGNPSRTDQIRPHASHHAPASAAVLKTPLDHGPTLAYFVTI